MGLREGFESGSWSGLDTIHDVSMYILYYCANLQNVESEGLTAPLWSSLIPFCRGAP